MFNPTLKAVIINFLKKYLLRLRDLQRILRFFLLDTLVLWRRCHIEPHSLLLVRLEGIGDYLLFRNFIDEIKKSKRFFDYSVTLCGSEAYRAFALSYDTLIVSDFIWINVSSFKTHLFYRWKKLSEIRKRGFEVVIYPTYSREYITGDSIVRLSGAQNTIGCKGDFVHAKPWERKISNRYYTELFDIAPSTIFEFLKNKEFTERLLHTTLFLRKPTLPLLTREKSSTPYAVVCSGSLLKKKKWPLDNFIQIMEHLHTHYGISSYLVGDERDLPSRWELRLLNERQYIKNLIGTTSLVDTTRIIQNASLVISNDTSISHIGVAMDKPVVVISNGEHFGRFTYPKEVHEAVFYAYPSEITKSTLSFFELVAKYQYGSQLNIKSITVETVRMLVDKALSIKKNN